MLNSNQILSKGFFDGVNDTIKTYVLSNGWGPICKTNLSTIAERISNSVVNEIGESSIQEAILNRDKMNNVVSVFKRETASLFEDLYNMDQCRDHNCIACNSVSHIKDPSSVTAALNHMSSHTRKNLTDLMSKVRFDNKEPVSIDDKPRVADALNILISKSAYCESIKKYAEDLENENARLRNTIDILADSK